MPVSRRTLLKSTAAAATLGGLTLIKPSDLGSGHNPYFSQLSKALDQAHFSRPTLIIDQTKLDQNIQTLQSHINNKFNYRIVAKSLPSLPLLLYIANQSQSNRFMVFNEEILIALKQEIPEVDLLLGKPLPISGTAKILDHLTKEQSVGIRWLVDSQERLTQFRHLAEARKTKLKLNLEIDIGLHRGGFSSLSSANQALESIKTSEYLEFDGFMGYEPHVIKAPGNPKHNLKEAMVFYAHFINLAKASFGEKSADKLTFNTAGSTTYQLHTETETNKLINELSVGSALVKPTDFDLNTLQNHHPACFIACPVLKALDNTEIPGAPYLGELMAWWNPNLKRSLFTYGGYWKAKPVSPDGLSYNSLYGRSSNQEMLNASLKNPLKMDDWIFLRPTQSEEVFRQFGDIAVFDGQAIKQAWKTIS